MKPTLYLVTSETNSNTPRTVFSVWDDKELAESERDRLNDIESRSKPKLWTYEVDEVMLNETSRNRLN